MAPVGPQPGDPFEGDRPICFAADGRHYPVIVVNGVDHGPDYARPLTWDDYASPTGFRYALPEDSTHNHKWQSREVEIAPETV